MMNVETKYCQFLSQNRPMALRILAIQGGLNSTRFLISSVPRFRKIESAERPVYQFLNFSKFSLIVIFHNLAIAVLYQRLIYLSWVMCLFLSMNAMNQASIPSHSVILPGGCKDHPSSSSVQFDFALLRSIDVDTMLASLSAPPLAMGTI